MAGFSRLMGEDEEGTLVALTSHRTELIEPTIAEYSGRVVKLMGDGILAEFASAVDAVNCAIAIQTALASRNATIADNQKILFRMGINVGDIIVEGDDIYGDGVNVAARLEGLAETGGVCISRTVRDQIRDKLDYGLEDLGEIEVKNIARPVRAFQVLQDGRATSSPKSVADNRSGVTVSAALLVIALISGGGLWWWQPWVERVAPTRTDRIAVPLPDKPSIAILPFANMSDDKQQAYFSAGITEDITTDLSKIVGLLVTPSSATLRYRGKDTERRIIAGELGVRHILEGGVRRVGNRLRITAKLIDASTGVQVWAERYDREQKDIFAIQDDIADRVVAELSKRLKSKELNRVARTYTPNLQAYDLYIQGRAKRIPPSPSNLTAALKLFEKAIELDPEFAGGYTGAAYVHVLKYGTSSPGTNPSHELSAALRLAEKAVKLDPTFGPAWGSLSEAYSRKRRFDDALKAIQRAIKAAPNDSLMRATYGRLLGHIGQPQEGIEQVKQAMRMSLDSLPMLYFLGANYRAAGKFDDAIKALTEHRKRLGGRIVPSPTVQLIASYNQAGMQEKARVEAQGLMKVVPRFTLAVAARTHSYKSADAMARFLGALRQAGIPE